MAKTIHVVRSGKRWVVQTSDGDLRIRYVTQQAAMENGATLAARERVNMVIHDRAGKIRFRLFLGGSRMTGTS